MCCIATTITMVVVAHIHTYAHTHTHTNTYTHTHIRTYTGYFEGLSTTQMEARQVCVCESVCVYVWGHGCMLCVYVCVSTPVTHRH